MNHSGPTSLNIMISLCHNLWPAAVAPPPVEYRAWLIRRNKRGRRNSPPTLCTPHEFENCDCTQRVEIVTLTLY